MHTEARIIDGRKTRDSLVGALREKVSSFSTPTKLAIIQVGDRPDSNSFVAAKIKFAKKIDVIVEHVRLPVSSSQSEMIETVRKYSADPATHGVVVQLPLPPSIDQNAVIDAIDPLKDVDALTASNVERWFAGGAGALLPATARGIRELCALNGISLLGKHIAVVGRSALVGRPIAAMCLAAGASVTVCHSKTIDLASETRAADIIIVAVGKPNLIGVGNVRPSQTVIDVGVSRHQDGALVGDVDFNDVKNIVDAITPVPGGVGPMTVWGLFANLVDVRSLQSFS